MATEFVKYSAKELRQLKKKFDALNYAERLIFWDTQPGFDYTTGNTRFMDDVLDSERNNPENHISIYPANKEETKQYNDWLLKHYQQKPQYNLESCKLKYFETVQKSANPIEYTEHEITEIENYLADNKKIHSSLRGYTWGYQSAVQNKFAHLEMSYSDFYKNAFSYAKGVTDAYYKSFLLEQLKKLKAGESLFEDLGTKTNKATVNETKESIGQKNIRNWIKLELQLKIVEYFETETVKIQLFTTGNKDFKERYERDLENNRLAQQTNERIQYALATYQLSSKIIYEADQKEFDRLFEEKFNIAKVEKGYKTTQVFAIDEAARLTQSYSDFFGLFPILKKWINYLENLPARQPGLANGKGGKKNGKEKRNYIPLAFYYYYMQSVGEINWFDNWQAGRESAYKDVVSKHFTNPVKTAWKQFQIEYTKIEKEHSHNRWQLCNRQNYNAVIEMLQNDSSKALAKAKEELNKAVD